MDKKQIERAVAVLLNNATFGCVSKYDDGTSTPNRLMQLECAEYLHSLISEEKFSDTYSFILGQFEAVEESEEKAGWKCVPLEPTQGMLDMAIVAFQETSKTMGRHAADKAAYRALIEAAPEQNRIQELISQRDHAMQDSQHWADKFKSLKAENEFLKRDCDVANLGFEANSKTIAFLKADNERLANNFKVNLAALHKVSNERNALQVQLNELSKLKTIIRKFMDKALPAGVCKTCEGEGEIGGQFCGGYQNCPDCNAKGGK